MCSCTLGTMDELRDTLRDEHSCLMQVCALSFPKMHLEVQLLELHQFSQCAESASVGLVSRVCMLEHLQAAGHAAPM